MAHRQSFKTVGGYGTGRRRHPLAQGEKIVRGKKVDYDFITDGSKRHKKAPVADQKQVSGDGRMIKRLSNEPDYFTVSSIMARVAPSMLRQ